MRTKAEPDYSLVSMTPGVRSGYPCVRRTGILVEVIISRFMAGESVAALAEDYTRPPDARYPHVVSLRDIEDAIRFVVWHWQKRRPLPHVETQA